MKPRAAKIQENKSHSGAHAVSQKTGGESDFQFFDNRSEAIAQRKLNEMANNSSQVRQLRAIQEMADNGSQAKQAAQLQASADNYSPVMTAVNDRPLPNTIQRYPTAMDDDSAADLGSFYSTDHVEKEKKEDYTAAQLSEIKNDVYMLTDFHPEDMKANCIGWSLNENSFKEPGNIHIWESEDHRNFTPTAADAGDAKIILWGAKKEDDEENENKWDVQHASVLLTHNEIATRSGEFDGFDEITTQALSNAGIADPCWTSVLGAGFGAITHPRDWFEGGQFGTALKGMK